VRRLPSCAPTTVPSHPVTPKCSRFQRQPANVVHFQRPANTGLSSLVASAPNQSPPVHLLEKPASCAASARIIAQVDTFDRGSLVGRHHGCARVDDKPTPLMADAESRIGHSSPPRGTRCHRRASTFS